MITVKQAFKEGVKSQRSDLPAAEQETVAEQAWLESEARRQTNEGDKPSGGTNEP